MPRASRMLLGLVIAGLCAAGSVWAYGFFGPGGVTEQQAILGRMQGIELENRGRKLQTPFLMDADAGGRRLRLAAFSTAQARFPYAWVELSRQVHLDDGPAHDFYMVPGDATLVVACQDVDKLLASEKVVRSVEIFIKAQCKG